MAGGISLHVVDVTRAVPAGGMAVEIFRLDGGRRLVAAGRITESGTLDHPITTGEGVERGTYEAIFKIGDFYRQAGFELPDPAFLEEAPFRFGVGDVAQHYHLPLKMSPWGFSLFRGA